ncbi:MAG TPA: TlpA disulfide reductase family protein [Steroidobacteraceae bacterium]|jgi:peroxiredoxin|nr:TlpA disulfide reductase family protein [Steroidobacteraceae bacterium]
MLTRWTKFGFVALATVFLATAVNAAGEEPAPTFSLPSRSGGTIDLAQFKGQVVMINFWASWCVPCRQEMPLLESIYKKYKPLGFTLIGVNVEPDQKEAENFLKQTPVSFPVLFDAKSKVSGLYNVQVMPTTVFIDRKGNVRLVHQSYQPGAENLYMDQIRTLIRE